MSDFQAFMENITSDDIFNGLSYRYKLPKTEYPNPMREAELSNGEASIKRDGHFVQVDHER